MEDLLPMIVVMFVGSFLVSYYLTMTILIPINITNNLTKFYLSLLMAFWMVFIQIGFALYQHPSQSLLIALIIDLILISIFSVLIRNQIGVGVRQFLLQMIEHHQMAITMAEKVQSKTDNTNVQRLVNDIITSQSSEITEMRELVDNKSTAP